MLRRGVCTGDGIMSLEITAVLFIVSGLLLIIAGIPMSRGKVKPNTWYGFRMPITQQSDEMWYATNAYAGKGLLVVGVIVMSTAVFIPLFFDLSADDYAIIMTVILLGTLFIMFGFSYRYAKQLDKQNDAWYVLLASFDNHTMWM